MDNYVKFAAGRLSEYLMVTIFPLPVINSPASEN